MRQGAKEITLVHSLGRGRHVHQHQLAAALFGPHHRPVRKRH